MSNVPQTYKHRTEACSTFRRYSPRMRHVTRVNRCHSKTTAFFEFRGQTSRHDQLTVQHWRSVHFRDSLDSKIVTLCTITIRSTRNYRQTPFFAIRNLTFSPELSVLLSSRLHFCAELKTTQQEPAFCLVFQEIPFDLENHM